MGYDIVAYFDLDKEDINEINNFINENSIDKKDWKQYERILVFYKSKYNQIKDLQLYYNWNESCEMHEIYSMCGTNFIRDNDRFDNRGYHKLIEDKVGLPFPECLKNINWTLRTSDDAIEIARGLRTFFASDHNLIMFADWLDETCKYCSTYELSY